MCDNATSVAHLVNEADDATGCRGAETCQAGNRCLTHDLWTDLSNQIYSFLSSVSLASLVKEGEGKEHAQRQVGKSNAAELLNFVS